MEHTYYDRNTLRWVELILLFIGIPICLLLVNEHIHSLLLPLMVLLAVACAYSLVNDSKFKNSKFGWKNKATKRLNSVILSFAVVAILSSILTYKFAPDFLFYIIEQNYTYWLILVFAYPLFSALPQEIIFRTFLFHRYKLILPSKQHRIYLSSFCFGFAHIFYANWLAVGLSMIAGYIFCITYMKTKSTLLVTLEHSLWGIWIFTIGMGGFFDSSLLT